MDNNKRKSAVLLFALAFFVVVSLLNGAGIVVGQGIIEPMPPASPLASPQTRIAIVRHEVDALIDGPVATVSVTQLFRNNSGRVIEGAYIFPLPDDAAIGDFQMTVDGQVLEGKLFTREEARDIYESIVRQQRDPALLEYIGQGLFRTSVFPIPPGEERTLALTYSQVIPREGKLTRFEYPLRSGHLSETPVGSLAVNVEIRNHPGLRTIYSVSHPVDVARVGDGGATITYEAEDVQPEQNFDLYFGSADRPIDAQLLSYKPASEDGYFMLLVTPDIDANPAEIVDRDITLVLDVSGSMEGEKIEQAQQAAHYVVDHLNAGDRFNLITFSTQPSAWRPQPTALDATAVDEVHGWIDDINSEGSTDINFALSEALAQLDEAGTRPAYILFLTDGLPTQGVTEADQIVNNALNNRPSERSVRLFTFGVGYDVNTHLLDTLSRDFGGRSSYVLPDERIDEAISQFYSGVSTPVLANIALAFGDEADSALTVEDIYPSPLPDLFAGEQLVVTGRYRTSSDGPVSLTLRLSGEINGESRSYDYPDQSMVSAGGRPFVARLWATRKIGAMLDAVRRGNSDPELAEAIVDLSLKYGITTPYTSYLVLEPSDAQARTASRQTRSTSPAASVSSVRSRLDVNATSLFIRGANTGEKAVRASIERETMQQARRVRSPDVMRYVSGKVFVPQIIVRDEQEDVTLWVESEYEEDMPLEVVQFGTARYFELASNRQVAVWLSVSPELVLVLEDGQAVRITTDETLVDEDADDNPSNGDASRGRNGRSQEKRGPWRGFTDWLKSW